MASESDRPAHELKDLGYEQVLGDIDATIDAAEQRLFEVTAKHLIDDLEWERLRPPRHPGHPTSNFDRNISAIYWPDPDTGMRAAWL